MWKRNGRDVRPTGCRPGCTVGQQRGRRTCSTSLTHCGWRSPSPMELSRVLTVSCRRWGTLSMIADSFAIIPLCPTASTGLRLQPRTELVCWVASSLLSWCCCSSRHTRKDGRHYHNKAVLNQMTSKAVGHLIVSVWLLCLLSPDCSVQTAPLVQALSMLEETLQAMWLPAWWA